MPASVNRINIAWFGCSLNPRNAWRSDYIARGSREDIHPNPNFRLDEDRGFTRKPCERPGHAVYEKFSPRMSRQFCESSPLNCRRVGLSWLLSGRKFVIGVESSVQLPRLFGPKAPGSRWSIVVSIRFSESHAETIRTPVANSLITCRHAPHGEAGSFVGV